MVRTPGGIFPYVKQRGNGGTTNVWSCPDALSSPDGTFSPGQNYVMNDYLRARGVELPVHPILRLRYASWDALEVGQATLTLPKHLAATFGADTIPSAELAARWRGVSARVSSPSL